MFKIMPALIYKSLEMDYVEVAPSQIILLCVREIHFVTNACMYVLGDLNFCNHFGATIAGSCRSHFPICMLILNYQYLCLVTFTSF